MSNTSLNKEEMKNSTPKFGIKNNAEIEFRLTEIKSNSFEND